MLLTEFFNSPEGNSYAKSKTTLPTTETKRTSKKAPYQKGRNMGEAKTKGNKTVPTYTAVTEDQWSGPNNAWNNGDDQWTDGRGQWSEGIDTIDTITVDVPLFIRLLEYAREDADTDMDLHDVAERAIELSQDGHTLSMDDYSKICKTKE